MRRILICLLLFLGFCQGLSAQTIPAKPSPARLVNDFAGLFTPAQSRQLEDSLVAFERATSTQIVVATVASLDGATVSDYALKILREWGVGQKGKDNGAVMLLKPNNSDGKGAVFIATGYGLEGVLPDSRVGRIIDNAMMPSLRDGDFYAAAVKGSSAIMAATRGEYTADEKGGTNDIGSMIGAISFIVFMIIVMAVSRKQHKGGDDDSENSGTGSGGGRGILPPIFWGVGGMGGGRSSGGDFGGFGGGGFGGFGGGMGGGGGAGRSF